MASSSLNYQIKYLRPEELNKLEEYLSFLTYKDLMRNYKYKFSDDRTSVTIIEMDTSTKVAIPMDEFIDKAGAKIKMFLLFKDLEKGKPTPK